MTTMIERILGQSAGITVRLAPDLCLINDGAGHAVVDHLAAGASLAIPERVVVVLDHSVPAGSFESAAIHKKLIAFARNENLRFIQAEGIGYHLLAREVSPGQVVVSAGSHNGIFGANGALGLHLSEQELAALLRVGSCPFIVPETVRIVLHGRLAEGVEAIDLALSLLVKLKAEDLAGRVVEFNGQGVQNLTENERLILCGTVTATGALSTLINDKTSRKASSFLNIDLSQIPPIVAPPENPATGRPLSELAGTIFHAAFVGGCNGGHIDNLRKVAAIVRGKRVARGLRFLIAPATAADYLQAMEESLLEVFLDAGAQVAGPGCASCKTDCLGVVGDGEVLISTGSHNFPGCCGTLASKVYLASVSTVARASLVGHICI